jgi:hypothetical protein
MKKTTLISLLLLLNMSVIVSAQDTATVQASQKPSKEDFFYTWKTSGGSGLSKYSFEVTFNNELSYILVNTSSIFKTKQTFIISKWEETINTYTDYAEEYPYGFKIFSKEDNNRSENNFTMFINADKTKYLSVINLGDYIQYQVYTKK